MKNYRDYDDFLRQFESHREKNSARGHLYREEGFDELNQKHGTEYNAFDKMDDMSDPMNKNYNLYRSRYYERYWDTHDNHAWYSLPMSQRAWLTFKQVSDFWQDCALLWLLVLPCFLIFNAKKRGKKIRLPSSSDNSANNVQ